MSTFTRAEIAKHNKASDCWVTYKGRVYNITEFLEDHPGGEEVVLEYAGKDIAEIMSDPLSHEHSASAYTMLDEFRIGNLNLSERRALADELEVKASGKLPAELTEMDITDDFEPDETDTRRDFTENKFLDLEQPLIPQMWYSSFTKEFYLEQVHIPRHKKDSARLMPYAFLEMFTVTPWYVVPMLWLPLAAAFFHVSTMQFREQLSDLGSWSANAWSYTFAFSGYTFGIIFWTFLEYIFHRFLFHMDSLLPRNQTAYLIHFLLHGIHHFLPMDRYRLVMPPILFAALSFPMLYLAHTVFPKAVANSVIAGSYSMYVVYDTMHYAMHHTKLPAYLREQKKYHLEHHYKNYELGFGVTSKLWDIFFSTLL
ncbi:4-hydroxysphinganine ceramide fatty acyl 2-hydroxylase [Malassezia vespertilionis]|uniref:4-hydroxysphinganine ceramide fatty acyl 2-hydroxylase n=1 Tax=Malassezia vespertilionis TaxID=2020962 RepID=UPI0024B24D4F|nr:4-hydroxysphinganine ceramide fatty acyl 2-hydroxylase [Malassezia vespertilionis]WFD08209.1 4-hydroxysphinganine ceramide fatty acyl 2-hydroxylase [Malassezia vespertilionis]